MKHLSFALLLTLLVLPFSCKNNQEETGPLQPIVILYENDVHCAIDGYAKLAGLRNTLNDSNYVAVVSAGDYLQGGTAGALSFGAHIMDIQTAVGYDAMTLGNHEFDYYTDRLLELTGEYNPPVVCANLYDAKTGERVFPAYVIRQYGPRKVAFIGALTPETADAEFYALHDEAGEDLYDLKPETVYQLVQEAADEARAEGADFVIVLSHLGEQPIIQNVDSHGLIAATTGIDAVLDGHSHATVPGEYLTNAAGEKVLISQTGTAFKNIGKLVIDEEGTISNELIPVDSLTEEDPAVAEALAEVKKKMDETAARVVGDSEVDLRINDEAGVRRVRCSETNTGDLLCDAMRYATGAQIALSNGGGIRTDVPAGTITYGDIVAIFPFVNYVCKVNATGDDILAVLEHCTRKAPEVEDGDFPQCSGIRYTVHTSDHRLSGVSVLTENGAWEPLDPEKTYSLATITYCVNGGGFGKLLWDCTGYENTGILYRDAVVDYITKALGGHIGAEYAKPQGRITFVK